MSRAVPVPTTGGGEAAGAFVSLKVHRAMMSARAHARVPTRATSGRRVLFISAKQERSGLGNPEQGRIVGDAFVGDEVPVLPVAEALRVAVKEIELGALGVQVGMNVVLLGDGGEPAVVEQP